MADLENNAVLMAGVLVEGGVVGGRVNGGRVEGWRWRSKLVGGGRDAAGIERGVEIVW